MKKIFFLMFVISSFTFAQNEEGGSIYSRYGLGLMSFSTSVSSSGMSGTGLALFDHNELNGLNPASWSKLKYTNFTTGAVFEGLFLSDNTGSKSFRQFNFNNAIVGIPIDKDNSCVLGIGIQPLSRVLYSISESQTSDSLVSTILYHGGGGLSESLLGLTYSPLPDLYIGIKGSYLFGNIRRYVRASYSDADYFNNELTDYLIASGFTYSGGLIYSGLSKFLNIPSFNIAFFYSPSLNLNCRRELSSVFDLDQTNTTFDTTLIGSGDLGIPSTIGFGLGVGLNERITIGADMIFQNWSGFNIMGVKSDQIKNSSRISAGAELLPEKDVHLGTFDRISYRLGMYYSDLNYRINNTDIKEIGASVGFSIPLSRSSILNSSFTYGTRGTKNNNLILDRFFRAQFSITLGEIWFVSPEEE